MDNIIIWAIIAAASIVWGAFHHAAAYNKDLPNQNFYYKSLELWRFILNYFVALTIVYYFVSVKGSDISRGIDLSFSDFILGAVFLMGIFGWLPYFVKNITEAIHVIFARVLNK